MSIIIMVLFVSMMVFPLVRSFWFYKTREGNILYINQDRIRDPRYFVISFTQMMDEQLEKGVEEERVYLSQKEKVLYWDLGLSYLNPCEQVVIAVNEDFIPPANMLFYKEIYAMKNGELTGSLKIRSIACKGDLKLNSHVEIFRWADAEGTFSVGDNCDLGICVSSLKKITTGSHCKFRRMYAPVIYLGCEQDVEVTPTLERVNRLANFQVLGRIKYNLKYITESLQNERGVVDCNIVTKNNLIVLEEMIVTGSIRSQKSIRICDHGIVAGNIFADGDIVIGRNVMILGNVFSQENIKVERGTIIGEKGKRSSIVARGKVTLEGGCMVYGYVSNEKGGEII